jgi:hypothetical protein
MATLPLDLCRGREKDRDQAARLRAGSDPYRSSS